MADKKVEMKKGEVKKDNYGKPKTGSFRIVKKIYKGKGKGRKEMFTVADLKDTGNILHGDLDKDKQPIHPALSLKEVYKKKAADKHSMIVKVIEA